MPTTTTPQVRFRTIGGADAYALSGHGLVQDNRRLLRATAVGVPDPDSERLPCPARTRSAPTPAGSTSWLSRTLPRIAQLPCSRRACRPAARSKSTSATAERCNRYIVLPGPWTAADFRYRAEHVATRKLHNAGHSCVASQVLILPAGWDGRPRHAPARPQPARPGRGPDRLSPAPRSGWPPPAGGARRRDTRRRRQEAARG